MSRLFVVSLVVAFVGLTGCGSQQPPAPLQMTPELEAQIKAQDAEVQAAESAQSKKKKA